MMNRRTTKYTKKQIQEALAYWKRRLYESGGDVQDFNMLVQLAQKMSPDTAKAAQAAKKIVDSSKKLDESTGGGIAIGIASTLLAICMIGKMSDKVKEYAESLDVSGKSARIQQAVDKSVESIDEAINRIGKELHDVLPEYFDDNLLRSIEDQFNEIMSQD